MPGSAKGWEGTNAHLRPDALAAARDLLRGRAPVGEEVKELDRHEVEHELQARGAEGKHEAMVRRERQAAG